MNYSKLEWDSDFFKFNVAKINDAMIRNENDLKTTVEQLKKNDFKLAYLFAAPNDQNLNKISKDQKGILVDKKVTFSIKKIEKVALPDGIKKYDLTYPSDSLIELAIQSGIYSRFKIDPNFKNKEFEKLYCEWITRSASKEIADEIFVYELNNKIVGFVTQKINNGVGQIGLIAVDMTYRGKGIGRQLINAAHNWYNEMNIEQAEVVTQMDNVQACKLYTNMGYSIANEKYIYHFWF